MMRLILEQSMMISASLFFVMIHAAHAGQELVQLFMYIGMFITACSLVVHFLSNITSLVTVYLTAYALTVNIINNI